MPLDDTNFTLPAVKPATFDPVLKEGLAGLAQLSEALRHPEWWTSHQWKFEESYVEYDCGTAGCACGVAHCLWPSQYPRPKIWTIPELSERHFGISEDESWLLFETKQGYCCDWWEVTPIMVADAIDALLASKGYEG